MYEDKYVGILVELFDTSQSHLKVFQNLFLFISIRYFKYIDQHLYTTEYRLFLDKKILLHKSILTSAIP